MYLLCKNWSKWKSMTNNVTKNNCFEYIYYRMTSKVDAYKIIKSSYGERRLVDPRPIVQKLWSVGKYYSSLYCLDAIYTAFQININQRSGLENNLASSNLQRGIRAWSTAQLILPDWTGGDSLITIPLYRWLIEDPLK